jgi:hypothetical protein
VEARSKGQKSERCQRQNGEGGHPYGSVQSKEVSHAYSEANR